MIRSPPFSLPRSPGGSLIGSQTPGSAAGPPSRRSPPSVCVPPPHFPPPPPPPPPPAFRRLTSCRSKPCSSSSSSSLQRRRWRQLRNLVRSLYPPTPCLPPQQTYQHCPKCTDTGTLPNQLQAPGHPRAPIVKITRASGSRQRGSEGPVGLGREEGESHVTPDLS